MKIQQKKYSKTTGWETLMEVNTKLMEDGRFIMFGPDISETKKGRKSEHDFYLTMIS